MSATFYQAAGTIVEKEKDRLILELPIRDEELKDKQVKALLFPVGDTETYYKRLVESLLAITGESLLQAKKSKFHDNPMSEDQITLLKSIGRLCSYYINSGSWRAGKIMEYDKMEFEGMITRCEHIVKYSKDDKE